MKKYVAFVKIMFCVTAMLILCSCSLQNYGYKSELLQNSWSAKLGGGAEVNLSFAEDTATLTLKSGDTTANISGKYLADEKTLVIFMPETAQNYTFEYTPKGEKLDLAYQGKTITLSADVN